VAVRGRAGEPRIDDHQVGAIDFLPGKNVLHRDRMRLGRVTAMMTMVFELRRSL